MYIHSVSLKNYKSIGERENTIILEPKVTAIIGKNESGKSNVLEGLSHISLNNSMISAFNNENINRNNGLSTNIEYTIILKPRSNHHIIQGDTQIFITKDGYAATGSILKFYNENIRDSAAAFIAQFKKIFPKLQGADLNNYQIFVSALTKTDSLDLRIINKSFDFFKRYVQKMNAESRDEMRIALEDIISKWDSIILSLPIVYYRKSDKILKTKYQYDEIQKELAKPASYPNSLLPQFVNLIEISNSDFIEAAKAGINGTRTSIRNKINRNVDSAINKKFQRFYTSECVSLSLSFDSGYVSFNIQSSDGETLLLSERSNGLRWFINTFIDLVANGVYMNNVLYLFDEPGISLHVNAQKELLKLFHDLANKGNQVVYTTHSPYMLDVKNSGIHRIRAVDKDEDGYTYIYKTAYDARLAPKSQNDTLTPIVNAIGMNLNNEFGPSKEKMNVVIEGFSDYIYIYTMAKHLDDDLEKYCFIPSVGATNCIAICNILYGWGCPFFAVFDYDKEGVEKGGEVLQKKLFYNIEKYYCYVKSVTQEDVDRQTYKTSPYVIEDLVTKEELSKFMEANNIGKEIGKSLIAKLFSTAVEEGSYELGELCKKNFEQLFERINKTCKK